METITTSTPSALARRDWAGLDSTDLKPYRLLIPSMIVLPIVALLVIIIIVYYIFRNKIESFLPIYAFVSFIVLIESVIIAQFIKAYNLKTYLPLHFFLTVVLLLVMLVFLYRLFTSSTKPSAKSSTSPPSKTSAKSASKGKVSSFTIEGVEEIERFYKLIENLYRHIEGLKVILGHEHVLGEKECKPHVEVIDELEEELQELARKVGGKKLEGVLKTEGIIGSLELKHEEKEERLAELQDRHDIIEQAKQEHEQNIVILRGEIEEHKAQLVSEKAQYEETIGKLKRDHSLNLQKVEEELKSSHGAELAGKIASHEVQIEELKKDKEEHLQRVKELKQKLEDINQEKGEHIKEKEELRREIKEHKEKATKDSNDLLKLLEEKEEEKIELQMEHEKKDQEIEVHKMLLEDHKRQLKQEEAAHKNTLELKEQIRREKERLKVELDERHKKALEEKAASHLSRMKRLSQMIREEEKQEVKEEAKEEELSAEEKEVDSGIRELKKSLKKLEDKIKEKEKELVAQREELERRIEEGKEQHKATVASSIREQLLEIYAELREYLPIAGREELEKLSDLELIGRIRKRYQLIIGQDSSLDHLIDIMVRERQRQQSSASISNFSILLLTRDKEKYSRIFNRISDRIIELQKKKPARYLEEIKEIKELRYRLLTSSLVTPKLATQLLKNYIGKPEEDKYKERVENAANALINPETYDVTYVFPDNIMNIIVELEPELFLELVLRPILQGGLSSTILDGLVSHKRGITAISRAIAMTNINSVDIHLIFSSITIKKYIVEILNCILSGSSGIVLSDSILERIHRALTNFEKEKQQEIIDKLHSSSQEKLNYIEQKLKLTPRLPHPSLLRPPMRSHKSTIATEAAAEPSKKFIDLPFLSSQDSTTTAASASTISSDTTARSRRRDKKRTSYVTPIKEKGRPIIERKKPSADDDDDTHS